MIYCLYTTVDITETRQRHGAESLEKHQQQNFDTVLQTIGLCGNVYYDKSPCVITGEVFGNKKLKVWKFEWKMEIAELFTKDNDHVAILKEIFQYVPIIAGLSETAKLNTPMFDVGKNILFEFK